MYKAKHRLAPSTVSELFNYIICFSIIAETVLERVKKLIQIETNTSDPIRLDAKIRNPILSERILYTLKFIDEM